MNFPGPVDCNNLPRKRGNFLHYKGHVGTTKNAWIAKQVSLVHVIVITLIGLYILIHLTHSVHTNVGVQSFIHYVLVTMQRGLIPRIHA